MPKKGKGRGKGRVMLNHWMENKAEPTVGRDDFPKLETTTSRSSKPASIPGSSSDCNSKSHSSFQGRDDFSKLETTISQSSKPAASSDCNSKSPTSSQGEKNLSKELDKVSLLEEKTSSAGPVEKTVAKFAPRPNFGKAGRPIKLISNYFPVNFQAGTVYHYDVEINSLDQLAKYGKPVKKMTAAESVGKITRIEHQLNRNVGKIICREVIEKLVSTELLQSYSPVYDGVKNIFTSRPLPFKQKMSFTVELEAGEKIRKYEVVIKPIRKENGSNATDLHSLLKTYEGQSEFVMAVNCIMNHRKTASSQIQVGRSFFYLNQPNKISLGEGLEVWFGYNQSLHLTHHGPAVVINMAAKAFHKSGPVLDYAKDVLRRDITCGVPMKPHEVKRLEEALRGLKVRGMHLSYPRKYVIEGISKLSAEDLKIQYEGNEMSIAHYYEIKYERLLYPYLPCLFMRSSSNQTYIPFENCSVIEGQPKLGTLNGALAGKMIRQTAIPPNDKFNAIAHSAQIVKKESGKNMASYKLFMDLNFKNVEGRVIDRPSLFYQGNNICDPDNRGVWRMDGKSFYKSSINIESWILLNFSEECKMDDLRRFIDIFLKTSKRVGLHFGRLQEIKNFNRYDKTEEALNNAQKTNAKFAVIVLSRKDTAHNYDEIKFIADYKLGFVTQCIEDVVLFKINDQIANNICLKINIKLGGINHILKNRPRVLTKPVIILGADAIHSPRGSGCPSIAAVVASMDAWPSKYKVECRVQENPDGSKISQELILDIQTMVENLLNAFHKNTGGKYPEKIIFFRDGVSEGQFLTVRNEEVTAVQKASHKIIGNIMPITYIVVQKRHQTRFRPHNPKDGVGRGCNIPPGTTVDADITHPELFDYFLNSHEGIQGTSKPAHYTVLHDDNNFDADELQMLSYHLCYTYGKCNRSVSIPAPVLYADLACYRAKKYADFHLIKTKSNGSSQSSSRLPEYVRDAINSMGQYRNNMFFL
ncbi:protein argonaute-2 [Trichonephila inaurata madagascariensis]|uniref:Protein argonaute-2 n=1 Tax=Trichonephila inaurata madagascariensis TaxID=2747483 RepID=A0A8X6XAT2_9ARAC|nr:protein argonaute-2 [Trichonephila inaurata madagascariensis]